ncbi:uncharacterized protein K452DRAFT_283192 [Aplosporella prunicola CBS 121167]|uniref:Uncharacterized protein n=1 Tax=Aplosporella prunicola CBS 121167 TaxID=1176127 RepID=A0A6A6BPA1_9PEZI|nr:uncharacterized protein K452DRAFT_283192 [Aplosporella prunicola CBS 121167]KAF2145896.1 hypothetical protein K452DRAFT_283192 [Aplosporella prunicola CBS 121167]
MPCPCRRLPLGPWLVQPTYSPHHPTSRPRLPVPSSVRPSVRGRGAAGISISKQASKQALRNPHQNVIGSVQPRPSPIRTTPTPTTSTNINQPQTQPRTQVQTHAHRKHRAPVAGWLASPSTYPRTHGVARQRAGLGSGTRKTKDQSSRQRAPLAPALS